MSTDLNSEFTHFNLVIRLSKVQQLALRLCTILRCPAVPAVPWKPWWKVVSSEWSQSEQPETPFLSLLLLYFYCCWFICQWLLWFILTWQGAKPRTPTEGNRHMLSRCGFFLFWWLSGEVKHFVHLIRWNLKAVLCPCGWLEHGPGLAQRTTPRF